MIGDTVSDYYLAERIKCYSILLFHGHQSEHVLQKTEGVRIANSFAELIKLDKVGGLYG